MIRQPLIAGGGALGPDARCAVSGGAAFLFVGFLGAFTTLPAFGPVTMERFRVLKYRYDDHGA